jgi:hypothetical protein
MAIKKKKKKNNSKPKKNNSKPKKNNSKPKKNNSKPKKSAAKKPATKKARKKLSPKNKKKQSPKKKSISVKKKIQKKTRERSSSPAFLREGNAPRSGGQSGDLQGLSRREAADSQSVEELIEEGNAFEADVVMGVESADLADGKEVRTHEVSEDDVPEEYLGEK